MKMTKHIKREHYNETEGVGVMQEKFKLSKNSTTAVWVCVIVCVLNDSDQNNNITIMFRIAVDCLYLT